MSGVAFRIDTSTGLSSFPPTAPPVHLPQIEKFDPPPPPSHSSLEGYSLQSLEMQDTLRRAHVETNTYCSRLFSALGMLHKTAKEVPFLNDLRSDKFVCSWAYTRYLCNLYVFHEALENAQRRLIAWNKAASVAVFEKLFRTSALLEDIDTWAPQASDRPEVKEFHTLTTAEEKKKWILQRAEKVSHTFAEKLNGLKEENLCLVFPSMFVLYGTLMSGSQFNKQKVIDRYSLLHEDAIADQGAHFFVIQGVPSTEIDKFKKGPWHSGLNTAIAKFIPDEDENAFSQQVQQASFTMQHFLDFIPALEKNC